MLIPHLSLSLSVTSIMHLLTATLILSLGRHLAASHPVRFWGSQQFKSLVSFGNSYTDQSRLNYFTSHNGSPPPVGWEQPDVREHRKADIR